MIHNHVFDSVPSRVASATARTVWYGMDGWIAVGKGMGSISQCTPAHEVSKQARNWP